MSFAPAQGLGTPADAPLVTVVLEDGLLAERKLTAGTGITLTDGGPNGNLTITNTGPCAADHSVLSGLGNSADHGYALLVSGTRALTANWDAGSFKITAETFESDIATGTAPFTVASTTVVANLNADLLDGAQASGTPTASTIPIAGGGGKLAAGWIQEVLALSDLTDVASVTGSGTAAVLNNTPTLLTPTIANFVNATHVHAAAASGGTIDHGALTGRADDDHSVYALLAGRAGGQTQIGGTAAENVYTIQATSHTDQGQIVFKGDAATTYATFDLFGKLGINVSPGWKFHVYDAGSPAAAFGAAANSEILSVIVRNEDNSATGATGFAYMLKDSGSNDHIYATTRAMIATNTDTAEDGIYEVRVSQAGTLATFYKIDAKTSLHTFSLAEVVIGRTTLWDASDMVSIKGNAEGSAQITIEDDTDGTATLAGYRISTDLTGSGATHSGNLYMTGPSFTVAGGQGQSQVILLANTGATGGVNVMTAGAHPVIISTNQAERLRVLATGELVVGATAIVGSELANFQKDQNAGTQVRIYNATGGTGANAQLTAASNTASGTFNVTSSTFTPVDGIEADALNIQANNTCSNGLILVTRTTASIKLKTNKLTRLTIESGGGVAVANELEVGGDFNHDGTNAGFFGGAPAGQVAVVVALTDSSGGSADNTIAEITNVNNAGSADVTPTANAIADLAAKVNAFLSFAKAHSLMASS